MNAPWKSTENYINHWFLEREGVTQLTKTVNVSYKAVAINNSEAREGDAKINGFSFFCDDFVIYAEMEPDEFILGLNNHTYLEFKRVDEQDKKKINQFRLIGVRSVDSLDQHQVILLQGVLMNPQVDFLSLK